MRDITATATLGDTVLARTTHGRIVEGNVYFPASDVKPGVLTSSALTTICPWKGLARYRHITTEDVPMVRNAAWTYPLPTPFAWFIRNSIAFEPGNGIIVRHE